MRPRSGVPLDVPAIYRDRDDAGASLAQELERYRGEHPVVLGIPRGGVPVAAQVAQRLGAELDVIVARKLGAPGHEELAIGAVTADGARFLNQGAVRSLAVGEGYLDRITARETAEARRREQRFRGAQGPVALRGRLVILVDDGLATGASMRAAVRALRLRNPSAIAVAVPIGSRDTCDQFRPEVEEVVCGHTPEPFHAVGAWYLDFTQTTDDEVRELLDRAAHERRVRRVREDNHATEVAGLR